MKLRSKKNVRMFNYGGAISKNLLIVDTADIKVTDFFNSFNLNEFDSEQKKLVEKLEAKIYSESLQENITMSDDRFIFIATKLMVKYPKARIYYGINEWIVVYEYLVRFYDKGVPRIDNLIRFVNLYIGSTYTDNDDLTGDELEELLEISDLIKFDGFGYDEVLPKFVIDAMMGNIQITEKQSKRIRDKKADAIFNKLFESIGV
jgi:hypothetical protein